MGRPKKYNTDEEREIARKQQKREWFHRCVIFGTFLSSTLREITQQIHRNSNIVARRRRRTRCKAVAHESQPDLQEDDSSIHPENQAKVRSGVTKFMFSFSYGTFRKAPRKPNVHVFLSKRHSVPIQDTLLMPKFSKRPMRRALRNPTDSIPSQ